jgi:hypothetical protein
LIDKVRTTSTVPGLQFQAAGAGPGEVLHVHAEGVGIAGDKTEVGKWNSLIGREGVVGRRNESATPACSRNGVVHQSIAAIVAASSRGGERNDAGSGFEKAEVSASGG